MSKIQISSPAFPPNVGRLLIEYRLPGEDNFERLEEVTRTNHAILIDEFGKVELRLVALDTNGKSLGASRTLFHRLQTAVEDRVAVKAPTDFSIKNDLGTISVKTPDPGLDKDRYEVRIGPQGQGPETSYQITITSDIASLNKPPGLDAYTVHIRTIRRDGQIGPWASKDFDTTDPISHAIVEDDNGINPSGTIETLYGYIPIETVGGEAFRLLIVPSIWNTTNTDSIWGMDGDVPIWALADRFPLGEFTFDAVVASAIHNFKPAIYPELNAVTQETQKSIWGMNGPWFNPPAKRRDPVGTLEPILQARDMRVWNTNLDQSPPIIEQDIAISQDGSTYDNFEPVIHGIDYSAKAHKLRVRLRSLFGTRSFSLKSCRLVRYILNRKWEWRIALDGLLTNGAMTYTFDHVPIGIVNASGLTAIVSILSNVSDVKLSFRTVVTALSATAITFQILQSCRDTVTTDGFGDATFTYVRNFASAPRVHSTVRIDASKDGFAGTSAIAVGSATIYAIDDAGAAVTIQDVDVLAEGYPLDTGLVAMIQLMGY